MRRAMVASSFGRTVGRVNGHSAIQIPHDAASAKYTGNPDELISALGKLESGVQRVPMNATPATAHLFILNPFSAGGLAKMFSTHPSTEDRIARLQAMKRDAYRPR